MASETAVVHLITFTGGSTDAAVSNLRGYVERELARSAPKGFLSAVVLEAKDGKSASLLSYWQSAEDVEDVSDTAPWEAAMDLCEAVCDDRAEMTYQISGAAAAD
ncbi:hypothetical protein [Pyruvatibacter sp.]|uniref:hypothetical protein n=1 Tax=Pyruvatibacter sp. TaxID=1981328 RepID=UPI0032F00449